jgi:hypothetical protein
MYFSPYTGTTYSAAGNVQVSHLMRYQQFASHAYCGAVGPVSKMASQQEKAFCVLRFEVSRSVILVQHQFRARFKKYIILVWCILNTKATIEFSRNALFYVGHICGRAYLT